ncbi:hypothetical protein [Pseudoduganella buxea]|uniref:Uncharacterized protein n=1 Tax=Pseudoduganella buxea TaxID=1949069 RepID=A0A6I3SQY0_9BURK|nr:hypothetical protein [Pseudoduganella buxea]MTV51471.1 hypothetical protein [Pseudoduganella buxea]GGB89251.1 hypothetical protein GCM10011572_09190 [Pseudoduganella buxea]
MKTINKTFTETVREAANAVLSVGRHAVRRLGRMSWPALLALCVMLALLLTILPLALTLFVIFLLAKLVIGAFGTPHAPRRPLHEPPQDTMHGGAQ